MYAYMYMQRNTHISACIDVQICAIHIHTFKHVSQSLSLSLYINTCLYVLVPD